jgi:hypothetical protein
MDQADSAFSAVIGGGGILVVLILSRSVIAQIVENISLTTEPSGKAFGAK